MPSMEFARIDPKTRELYFVREFPQVSVHGTAIQPESVLSAPGEQYTLPDVAGLMEDVPFLVLAQTPLLEAERALQAGFGITITDYGPNGNLVVAVNDADILALVSGAGFVGQITVALNGTTIATRGGVDFIEGAGVSLTAVDDPFANLVHLTVALDPSTVQLDDLADVIVAGSAAGQHLAFDGANWVSTWPDRLIPDAIGAPELRVDAGGYLEMLDGFFAVAGDRRARRRLLAVETADATATVLTEPRTAGRVTVPANGAMLFEALVLAREVGGSRAAGWRLRGVAARDATASSVRFVGGAALQEIVAEDAPGWDARATLDTSAGTLDITVTGEASTTIRWLADLRTVEITV